MKDYFQTKKTQALLFVGLIALLFILRALFFPSVTWQTIPEQLQVIKAMASGHPILFRICVALIYIVISFAAVFPAILLSFITGAILGFGDAMIWIVFWANAGALTAFLSARYLFRDWVQERFAQRLSRVNRELESDGVYYIFFLRVAPVLPFSAANLLLGLSAVRASSFILASVLGTLPGTALLVKAGADALESDRGSGGMSLAMLIAFFVIGALPLWIRKIFRRHASKSSLDPGPYK